MPVQGTVESSTLPNSPPVAPRRATRLHAGGKFTLIFRRRPLHIFLYFPTLFSILRSTNPDAKQVDNLKIVESALKSDIFSSVSV